VRWTIAWAVLGAGCAPDLRVELFLASDQVRPGTTVDGWVALENPGDRDASVTSANDCPLVVQRSQGDADDVVFPRGDCTGDPVHIDLPAGGELRQDFVFDATGLQHGTVSVVGSFQGAHGDDIVTDVLELSVLAP
jgi:hypothetical protein